MASLLKKGFVVIAVLVLSGHAIWLKEKLTASEIDFYRNAVDSQDVYVDAYAAAGLNGKWGFVNEENRFVVEPEYASVQNTEGDYFFVCRDVAGEKCAYMNKKTKFVITGFKYVGCGNGDISDGFYDGRAKFVVVDANGDWRTGYIDKAGKEVIPAKYYHGTRFKNGVAEVEVNKEFPPQKIKIDKNGKVID